MTKLEKLEAELAWLKEEGKKVSGEAKKKMAKLIAEVEEKIKALKN